ncbi:MAG: hypothetical protein ACXADB_14495 [Candidatus Hermodarchaeia archaeon]|jgi:hypothetical protein
MDKDQKFVSYEITRKFIACELNGYWSEQTGGTPYTSDNARERDHPLAPDDKRLTDEICQEYATRIGQAKEFHYGNSPKIYGQKLKEIKIIQHNTLHRLGLLYAAQP